MKLNIQIQNIKGQLKIRRLVGTQNLPLFAAHRYIETLQKNAVEKSHMCFPDVCVPTKTPCPWKDVNSASHAASVAENQQQIARCRKTPPWGIDAWRREFGLSRKQPKERHLAAEKDGMRPRLVGEFHTENLSSEFVKTHWSTYFYITIGNASRSKLPKEKYFLFQSKRCWLDQKLCQRWKQQNHVDTSQGWCKTGKAGSVAWR